MADPTTTTTDLPIRQPKAFRTNAIGGALLIAAASVYLWIAVLSAVFGAPSWSFLRILAVIFGLLVTLLFSLVAVGLVVIEVRAGLRKRGSAFLRVGRDELKVRYTNVLIDDLVLRRNVVRFIALDRGTTKDRMSFPVTAAGSVRWLYVHGKPSAFPVLHILPQVPNALIVFTHAIRLGKVDSLPAQMASAARMGYGLGSAPLPPGSSLPGQDTVEQRFATAKTGELIPGVMFRLLDASRAANVLRSNGWQVTEELQPSDVAAIPVFPQSI